MSQKQPSFFRQKPQFQSGQPVEYHETPFPLVSPPNSPQQPHPVQGKVQPQKHTNRFQKNNQFAVGVQRKGIVKNKNQQSKRCNKYDARSTRLVSFNFPKPCNKFKNKRFDIEIHYREGNDAKIHRMTIAFGDTSVQEFIDHKDRNRRAANICRLQNTENPFHKNFYRMNLLNGEFCDLFDNFKAMCKNNGLQM